MTDLRNLPPEVLARLADHGVDLAAARAEAVQRGRTLEARTFARPEIRLSESGDPIFEGYATVYDYAYDVAGGIERGGWAETIVAGACDKSVRERDDVRLLLNHDGVPMARTKSKTLELKSDGVGLWSGSTLDGASPLVQTVRSAMDRGDLDEMSFAFQVIRQEWNGDYTERRILEVKLFDVSVVTYPANPAAVAQLRQDPEPTEARGFPLSLALAELDEMRLLR
jgi:HK97 family phage prohead protease